MEFVEINDDISIDTLKAILNSTEDTFFFSENEKPFSKIDEFVNVLDVNKSWIQGKIDLNIIIGLPDRNIDFEVFEEVCRNYPTKTVYWIEMTPEKEMTAHLKYVYRSEFYLREDVEEYSRDDVEEYLRNFWSVVLRLFLTEDQRKYFDRRCGNYIDAILKNDEVTKFVGNALKLRMIAEIFLQDVKKCSIFLMNREAEFALDNNISNFYRRFIDLRIDNVFKRRSNKVTINDLKKHYNIEYQNFAFSYLFPNEKTSWKDDDDDDDDEIVYKFLCTTGLVIKAGEGYEFIHRSFAEYFVAELYLYLLQREDCKCDDARKFLSENIIFENSNIYQFVEFKINYEHDLYYEWKSIKACLLQKENPNRSIDDDDDDDDDFSYVNWLE